MKYARVVFRRALALGAATLLLTSLADAAPQTQGSFERSLTVGNTPNITVQTGAGNITVTPGTDSTVRIHGMLASSRFASSDVAERIRRIEQNPPIEQRGSTIVVGRFADRDVARNISISYELTVPANTQVKSTAGSGNVRIESIGGPVTASTGSGNVTVLRTGGEIAVTTGSGGVEIDSTGGSVRASTGSGTIHVTGVSGSLSASTGSGNIRGTGTPRGAWELSTGSGNIDLDLPDNGAFTLDAHTGSGSIDTTQPITLSGRIDRATLRGAVRGGGPLVKIRTGSGSIRLD
jgi:DUF4097 and DUF4098 domain-containing protein YvlB